MTGVLDLLLRARAEGVRVSLEAGSLVLRGRGKRVTPECLEALRVHQVEIGAFLKKQLLESDSEAPKLCPSCELRKITFHGPVCVSCAPREQTEDDRRRRLESAKRGETPAEKCQRGAEEYRQEQEAWRRRWVRVSEDQAASSSLSPSLPGFASGMTG